ncbi:MAG: 50S ribosomal protein L15 [Actinobacteria bacterium]|nr:50S ribosomal protein L15 [Actinomycetota bacterium]
MKLHDLKPAEGSRKAPQRVGRGIGGKGGKTAGRGTKGQKARGTIPSQFEGGQIPLLQRIPKLRGFNNPFRVSYTPVNVDMLERVEGTVISPETLLAAGLLGKGELVKILGRGELSQKLEVSAHGFSASAEAAITAAGGSITKLPMPFGNGRPAAKGNQHTNR